MLAVVATALIIKTQLTLHLANMSPNKGALHYLNRIYKQYKGTLTVLTKSTVLHIHCS